MPGRLRILGADGAVEARGATQGGINDGGRSAVALGPWMRYPGLIT